jgi:hypothetical protein
MPRDGIITDELIVNGWWDIARPGVWRGSKGTEPQDIEITLGDLQDIVRDYNHSTLKAPITLDHSHAGPAYGWVEAVRVAGDKLQARFSGVSDHLKYLLKNQAYANKSIEMYKPFKETGRAYLSALTFLGSAMPAVKGLDPVPSAFGEQAENCYTVIALAEEPAANDQSTEEQGMEFKEFLEKGKEFFPNMFKAADEQAARLSEKLDQAGKALDESTIKLSEATKRAEAAEKERDELKAKLAESEQAGKFSEFKAGMEKLVKDGKVTRAEADQAIAFAEKLPDDQREAYAKTFESRNLNLFAEISPAEDKGEVASRLERHKARYKDFPEDPEHDAAHALMAEAEAAGKPITFAEAIKEVRLAKQS